MPNTQPPCSLDDLARLGTEVFARRVRPNLRSEDNGKFVAVDLATGDYEIDEDDHAAVLRLLARHPAAEVLKGQGSRLRTKCDSADDSWHGEQPS
jgi:hypothetical protein